MFCFQYNYYKKIFNKTQIRRFARLKILIEFNKNICYNII